MAVVGRPAPEFDLPCTGTPEAPDRRASLARYHDRWLILVFYPRDFSQICPTELTALSGRMPELRRRGADVLGVSTDTLETHERWVATPRSRGGLGGLEFPLASDGDGAVSRAYGVYRERQHIALRGLFIVDPNGVLQYQVVHNLSVGRRADEVLRVLAALETGGLCPEDWRADDPTMDPTPTLQPGSMLSHYRIEEHLGSGSSATVYRTRDTMLERTVALKVFKAGGLPVPAAVLAEARATAALNHPNVCTLYAVDDAEGVPLIAMEYVVGRPLSALLQAGALPAHRAARIGRQVAEGMAAAHALGIVHADLKPANIMLTRDESVKITDFGLAHREVTGGETDETLPRSLRAAGRIAGTPRYMSPEQTRGAPPAAACDVFALGVCLYEMLTGHAAFPGESISDVFGQIRGVDPGRCAAQAPERFRGVLRAALARDPRDRVISMQEFAAVLREAEAMPGVAQPEGR